MDGMTMVYVPAGEFIMGSTNSDPEIHKDEQPQHSVTLDAFWIDRTEVSNGQYRSCVDAGVCTPPTCDWGENTYDDATRDDYPVACVNWKEVQAYCAWVGGHLPTEAQWEKAARGTTGLRYPWGEVFDPNLCNSEEAGIGEPLPVGQYSPAGDSPYGVADMAGNVWEWVTDYYDIGYYATAPSENPTGPAGGERRSVRGGSWYGNYNNARTAYRYYDVPYGRSSGVGFRCVLEAAN
jgi:formylglycine-generating enzyme required for sulfatase activity